MFRSKSNHHILDVLCIDDHIIAVNKPAGMPVHATSEPERGDLIALVETFLIAEHIVYKGPLAPANRLDMDTSGVVLIALHPAARKATAARFADREVRKAYLAVVAGKTFPKGVVNRPLKAIGRQDRRTSRVARTKYRRLAITAHASYLKVFPKTGRKHQIRRHFDSIGHPILGDLRYGNRDQGRRFREAHGVERFMLHARQISMKHPITDEPYHVVASPGKEWDRILKDMDLVPETKKRS